MTDTTWQIYHGGTEQTEQSRVDAWLDNPPPWRGSRQEQGMRDRDVPNDERATQRGERFVCVGDDLVPRVNFALMLRRPLLVTGEPGLGKLKDHLSPLLLRLPLKVGKLMEMDKASREHFGKLGRHLSGDTCLADYYAERKGGFTAAIPDWSYKVEKRVRQVLGVSDERPMDESLEKAAGMQGQENKTTAACARCKLRHLPPCISPPTHEGGGMPARRRMSVRT